MQGKQELTTARGAQPQLLNPAQLRDQACRALGFANFGDIAVLVMVKHLRSRGQEAEAAALNTRFQKEQGRRALTLSATQPRR